MTRYKNEIYSWSSQQMVDGELSNGIELSWVRLEMDT